MLLYAVLICLPMLAFCQQDALANSEFNIFDLNKNHNIEPNEVLQYFTRFDTNKDNKLSRAEYRAEVDTHHINNPQNHQTLLRLFDGIDYDANHFLDQSDFTTLFTNADANKNHLIDHNEFVTYFHQLTSGAVVG